MRTRPYAQPHPPNQQQMDPINEQTTKAEEQRIPTNEELTHRHAVRDACDRHATSPVGTPTRHSQPLGVCSRLGVEASDNGVDVQATRVTTCRSIRGFAPLTAYSPLGPTPHEENQRDLEATESVWSRISSVSRRGFTQIYEFLTGSRDAASQGSLDPNSRHFSPPTPRGGGGCAAPPP